MVVLGIVPHKTFTMSLIESDGPLVSAQERRVPGGVEPGIAGAVDNPASSFFSRGGTPP
jgi:hypothetical protein